MKALQPNSIAFSLTADKVEELYRGNKYTVREIADKLRVSYWWLYNFMDRYNINRRGHSEASYLSNRLKPKFREKHILSFADSKLKIAGIMLYWAEGTFIGNTVDFTNSNPDMIRLFLKFLRNVCGVSENRLRVYLYGYSYHDVEELKKYWGKITGIPLSQFTKPYIRKDNPNFSNRKLPHGLTHIRYNDKRLLFLIKNWIEEYIKRAGT